MTRGRYLGRLLSADPAGLAAVNPANPQTWDAYSYAGNQPLEYTDPVGLGPGPCPVSPQTGKFTCTSTATGGPSPWQLLDPVYWQFVIQAAAELGHVLGIGGDSSADPSPKATGSTLKVAPTPRCPHGAGAGLNLGASAEAGAYLFGAGAQTSLTAGAFDSADGASGGVTGAGGAFARWGGASAGAPRQSASDFVAGAFVGASIAGGELTNAGSPSQLAGPFDTWTLNAGLGLQGTFQFSRGADGTWTFSVSFGPGLGLDFSRYQTSTAVRAAGGCS